MIRHADTEIIVKTKASRAEVKLLKKMLEWEGERNQLLQDRDVAVKEKDTAINEGVRKARKEWEKTYVTKKKYYEMKGGLEGKYKEVEEQLMDVRSKTLTL
ncbi:hypothetical protein ONS95_007419 [Cadophora gregata]|uniref:uncharacterized protein n=1 Tax=Cadophora gregata TaxID=51156 RepID=UPI0026DA8AC1|nr:uncharacterized protein ONS95_007419 [Cadophora gregata]KAK0125787.1 hypothetical protein ONS95_007419 [Cadophora gregata]